MNKVYKVVWNASLGVWIAVSELAKSKSKSKSVKKNIGSVIVAATAFLAISANAQDINEDLNVTGDITATGVVTGSDVVTDGGVSLNSLNDVVTDGSTGLATKASQTDLTNLTTVVDGKASQTDLTDLTTVVNGKASQTDFSALNNQVNDSATGLATKASKTEVNAAKTEVTAGNNIVVTPTTGTNGQTVYNVKTADEVTFNKVTVDGTVIDDGQVTVTKDGTVAAGSQQVITGNQLFELEQKLFNSGAQGIRYFHANSTLDDSAAYGADSVAVGPNAVTNKSATDAIAIGTNAVVGTEDDGTTPAPTDGVESIAIGKDTKALGNKNTVIGQAAEVDSKYVSSSLALGDSAKVTGDDTSNALAIGSNSVASAASASAVGNGSVASGGNATAIGSNSTASGGNATAVGSNSTAGAANGTALGANAAANSNNAVSIGNNAGQGTNNIPGNVNQNHIAIGTSAGQNITGNENIAIGLQASNGTSGNYNIAIGSQAGQGATGAENVSIGHLSNQNAANDSHTTALGARTESGQGAVAVGYTAIATSQGAVAIGGLSKVQGVDDGTGGVTNAENGVALGSQAWSQDNSVALGANSIASSAKSKTESGYITSSVIGDEGVISVGADSNGGAASFNRRIVHVADGAGDYDAVNVNQLRKAQEKVATLVGGGVTVDPQTGGYSSITVKDKDGIDHSYDTIADAFNAVSTGDIQIIDPAANAVTYTDSTSKQVNLRPDTVISGLAAGKADTDAVNVAQMNETVEASRAKYISVNSTALGNRDNTGATGVDAVAIGPNVTATSKDSTAIGSNIQALGESSAVIGSNSVVYDTAGVAIGNNAISRGEGSVVIGKDAKAIPQTSPAAKIDNAIAIGTQALVSNEKGIAIGQNTIASGEESIAQGYDARSSGSGSVALGVSSRANAVNAYALGTNAASSANNALALGNAAQSSAADSIATGTNSRSYATNAVAMGKGAVSGKANPSKDEQENNSNSDTIAIGTNSFAQIKNALAIGNTAKALEESSLALGTNSQATKKDAISVGQNAQATEENAIAIGANTTVTHENAVALGNNSVSGDYNQTTKATINGRDYNYAGSGAGLSTVSVGSANSERQIINVAAGRVTSTSTDAINGSQLYAVQQEVQQPLSFKGDSGTKVDRKLGQQLNVTGGATGTLTDGNIGVVANGSDTLQLKLAKDVNLTSTGSLTIGSTSVTAGNVSGLTNTDWDPTATYTGGWAATQEQLKSVSDTAQNASKGWNLTTNNDTSKKSNVAPDATVDFSNSDKNITLSHTGTNVDVKLAEVVNIGGQPGGSTIIVNGKDGTVTGLTNKVFDPNNFTSGRAATEDQLATPLTFTGDNAGVNVQRKLGQQLSIVGGESVAANLTDNNIGVVADSTNNKLTVKLAKDLKVESVNAAGTVIDSTGLTFVTAGGGAVPNSPSISATGINAGTNKITNVGAGDITDTSMDAVNGSQIKGIIDKGFTVSANGETASSDTIALGENVDFKSTDTNIKVTNTGNNQITFGLEPVIKVGPATGGNPVTINGNTGEITGLTNKTLDVAGFATVGRAATEEQLKSVQTGLTDAGFGLKAADGNTVTKKLGETVDVVGADSNISTKVVGGQVAIELAKNIDLTKAGSLTVGNTKVTDGKVELKDGAKSNTSTVDGTVVSDGTNTTTVGASQITVGGGGNPVIINGSTGHINGLTNTAWDPNGTYNQKQAATEEQLKAVSDVAQTASKGWNIKSDSKLASTQVKPEDTVDIGLADGESNLKVAATNTNGTTTIDFSLSKDLVLDSVNAGGTVINNKGLSFVDPITGSPILNSPSISSSGINAGNQKITNVKDGEVSSTSKDAVNGSQLHDLGSGVKNIIGGNTTYDPNTGTYVNNNIGDTGENNINDAIKSVNDAAKNANEGWNLTTNGANKSQVKPTDTVDFANKDGNIKINNTGNNITVDLAKDINVDSVTAGDTTVNSNGLTITGGPSVTKDGINAADKKVTGVADGSIAQNSKDAVNGSQIHDIIGDGAFQGGDGNTITNIGGTGETNINDAIGSINQKAGQHSTVVAGQNMTVKESTNSNGGKEYTVATADDVKFNSVTSNTVTANTVKVGDVNIDQNGINAGNHKITNVAPGEISSTSKDAVNGSQLNTSNQYIVNSLGGGAKYENGQFTEPTYNVNNGSYHNVGDALGALNQADIDLGDRITNLGDRLEQVIYNVNGRIDDVEKKANAGIAAALALEAAPFIAGKYTYAVGAAYHGGENAVGATLRKTSDNGRWSLTGGVAVASQGDPSVRLGVSGVID